VALGGEMHNSVDCMFPKELFEQHTVADISMDKGVPPGVGQGLQVFQAACVGQCIQVKHFNFRFSCQQVMNKIRADESGPACHQDISHETSTQPRIFFPAIILHPVAVFNRKWCFSQ
jgi:hypothetical protein